MAAGCRCCPSASQTPRIRRQPLVRLPDTFKPKSLYIAPDAEDFAAILMVDDSQRVLTRAGEGPAFKECDGPSISPGQRKLFYWAADYSTGAVKAAFVAGGETFVTEYAHKAALVFSPKGRWALIGMAGQPGTDPPQRGPVVIYVDGARIGSYADASTPVFSPDEQHFAFLIEDDAGAIKLVVDGAVRRTFAKPEVRASAAIKTSNVEPDMPKQFSVHYQSDGTLLILTLDREGWTLYRDDVRLGAYAHNVWGRADNGVGVSFGEEFSKAGAILASSVTTAERAPVAAWWERAPGDEERWRVAHSGGAATGVCMRAWESEPPALSADGAHLAYACHATTAGNPDEVYIVADGTRFGPYQNAWGLTFSPDGKRFVYAADDGSPQRPWAYYIDGKPEPFKFDRVFPPRFSPDSQHVVWVAERNEKFVLFYDGRGRASSHRLIAAPRFDEQDRLSWAIQRGPRVTGLKIEPH